MPKLPRALVAAVLLSAACSSPEPARMTYPATRSSITWTPITASGARPVPLARGRHVGRDRGLGRGAERDHVRAPETIPFRAAAQRATEQLFDYPKFGEPFRRGNTYFFFEERRPAEPGVRLPPDRARRARQRSCSIPIPCRPTAPRKLGIFSVSTDGTRAVYGLSVGGSDWHNYKVLDVASKQPLADTSSG